MIPSPGRTGFVPSARAASAAARRAFAAITLMSAAVGAGPAAAQDRNASTLTLAEATRSALSAHPSVTAARARVQSAEEVRSAARATRLPGVQLDASLTRFQEPMIVSPLHSLDLRTPPRFDPTLVQGRLGAAYTVFDGGARSSRITAADAMLDGARLGREATDMALLESVAVAYFSLHAARVVRDGADAQRQALVAEEARARQAVEAGTAAQVELLRAGAARQEAEAQFAGATARVALAERSLARITGLPVERVEQSSLEDRPLPSPGAGPEPAGNPLIARAARAVSAAEARASEERASRLPRLDAGAGVLDFGTLQGRHVFEWQAGVQLSWPLFTGGARSASVRRAQAEVHAAQADLAQAELDVQSAIDAAGTAITEADARAEALESAVTQWAEVARIEALALDAGSGVQSDLLRAQAGLFQARAGLARARADAALARVALARALGTLDQNWLSELSEIPQ